MISETGPGNNASGGFKVLVIEDEQDAARAIESFLRFRGHTIFLASDGQEAMEIVKKHDPDIMVCDWMLGEGDDGISLIAEIQTKRLIPAILMTGHRVERARAAAASLGIRVIACKAKPISLQELASLIETLPVGD